ncbi:MAG: radical SAM protein [Desulfarculales bacterium]|jgi:uncharacterized radical SAM superfamily Fe-S cluster-containing enzyme|nr:radical SAM protein [Desulfarculales bacterium]
MPEKQLLGDIVRRDYLCCGALLPSGPNNRPGITVDSTRAFCRQCNTVEHAVITARDDGVFMERVCPRQGSVAVRLAASHEWYIKRARTPRPQEERAGDRPVRKGCPWDCGPCQNHSSRLRLPIFSITNQCNLACPICFTYNRPDKIYHKSIAELETILEYLKPLAGDVDLLDITGGEPTLHPQLLEFIDICAKSLKVKVGVNSNGLRLGSDYEFAKKIKDSGAQLILSLDTLDEATSIIIHGRDIVRQKLAALETLEKLDIPTVILIVAIAGVNEDEAAALVKRFLPRPFVKGVTIQNMTFTGRYGQNFTPRRHITLDEVENLLASKAGLSSGDFFAHASYHPLCYSVAYYWVDGDIIMPLSQFVRPEVLREAMKSSYLLRPGKELSDSFINGVYEQWAQGIDEKQTAALKKIIKTLYPHNKRLEHEERIALAGNMLKTVYIHAHMDEDNFDIGRIASCGDLVPDESGRMIPACSYNLLYRRQDERFWVEDN